MYEFDKQCRRVVIYARISTEHKEQLEALENQLEWYKPIIESHPEWEIVEWYIDKGITGTSAEKRPRFMQMIEDAKKKMFDLIITREVSRFARNTVDTLQYTRLLKEYKVDVYFINDNIRTFDGDGELRLTIMATLAQDESRKTSVRVKAGQQTKMESGIFFGNGNILGYDRVDKTKFVINHEQAQTVRLIYDLYLKGWGLQKIQHELEHRGRKTAMGNSRWHATVISDILQNSFYCGIITYHKEYVPDFLKQKKIRNYGEIELTQVKGTHEPIVTVEEYERVQAILDSKRRDQKNNPMGRGKTGKLPRKDLWGKLLVCSCGHSFSKRVWTRTNNVVNPAYLCYSSVHNGSYQTRKNKGLSLEGICDTPMIPEWKLRMMANIIFREFLTDKDKVLDLAYSMLKEHVDVKEDDQNTGKILEQKQSELERQQRKRDNLVDMRIDGEITKDDFQKRLDPIDKVISELRIEISSLTSHNEPQKDVENCEEKLTFLHDALARYASCDDRDVPDNVIEGFVEKIVASKDGFDWYFRIDGDPNDPLKCQVNGKRQKKAVYTIGNRNFPAEHYRNTGSPEVR